MHCYWNWMYFFYLLQEQGIVGHVFKVVIVPMWFQRIYKCTNHFDFCVNVFCSNKIVAKMSKCVQLSRWAGNQYGSWTWEDFSVWIRQRWNQACHQDCRDRYRIVLVGSIVHGSCHWIHLSIWLTCHRFHVHGTGILSVSSWQQIRRRHKLVFQESMIEWQHFLTLRILYVTWSLRKQRSTCSGHDTNHAIESNPRIRERKRNVRIFGDGIFQSDSITGRSLICQDGNLWQEWQADWRAITCVLVLPGAIAIG